MTRDTREHGSAAILILAFAGAAFALLGLIWDASVKIDADRRAQTVAQEAARAGGQAITIAGGGAINISPSKGAAAAKNYLTAAGVTGTVTTNATTMTVTTTIPWNPIFLPGGGTAHGSATATIATP